MASAIFPTSVWICDDTEHTEQMLAGQRGGYVYQRDGHPNADFLIEKCQQLHGAERAAITSSGMAALALALLSQLQSGDHIVVSRSLYGQSLRLTTQEAQRLGIEHTVVDPCDWEAVEAAMSRTTKLLVVETIANPTLEVADVAALAERAHRAGAKLLIDNTFATPGLCRPLRLGADLVIESLSKLMNGHSDVMLGLLVGRESDWKRVPMVLSAWGFASSPFDCWLAARGLATMHLRLERACQNAQQAARFLASCPQVERVDYPGLPEHRQHDLAARQFGGRFGSMVTFHLAGGRSAADRFIQSAQNIPFCPSLGEAATTLSHPESTSHRALSPQQRSALGIHGGTVRLSLGIESEEFVLSALEQGFAAVY